MGRTKGVVYGCFRISKARGVQLTANIAASGHISIVHLISVHGGIGNNRDVVGGRLRVTSAKVIVKCGNTIGHITNFPIVTDIHIRKRSVRDCRPLCSGDACA